MRVSPLGRLDDGLWPPLFSSEFPMRALLRNRVLVALGVLAFTAACEGPTAPTDPSTTIDNAQFTISDAANDGRAGFYFLPPTVSNSGPFSGEFDATLSPVVRVCRWVAGACAGDDMVFTRGAAPQSVMLTGMPTFSSGRQQRT